MISNSSKYFLKIQWPRMMLDDKKQEPHAEALPSPSRARWQPGGLFQEHLVGLVAAPCSPMLLSFGHRRRGMISDSVTNNTRLLQRLGMVTEVNQLSGCRGLGGQGTRTPRLWCSTRGTNIQAALLLALASTGLLLVPLELITVSALCSPAPLGRAH